MPPLPDAEQLLTLLAVEEAGNESAAAALLGVGQSSVSRRLAALQQLASAPLTQRTSAGTRLTPAGTALLGAARDVRRALGEAAARLDPGAAVGTRVRLGVSPHLVARLAGAAGARAASELELVEAHSEALLAALRRGELTAAVTLAAPAGGEPGLRAVRVGEEALALAAHPGEAALRHRGGAGPDLAALGRARWLVPAAPSVVGERARLLLRRAGLGSVHETPMPSPAAVRAGVLAGAGLGVALASELRAEAAAGWLTLAPLPFGEAGDDRLAVWLLLTDAAPREQAELLEAVAAEAMRD